MGVCDFERQEYLETLRSIRFYEKLANLPSHLSHDFKAQDRARDKAKELIKEINLCFRGV